MTGAVLDEDSSSSDSSDDELAFPIVQEDSSMEELNRKQLHPDRLHQELW